MDRKTYEQNIQKLVNPKLNSLQRLDNFALGLVGEAAEVFKVVSHPIDYRNFRETLVDELGDTNWYFTNTYVDLGITFVNVGSGFKNKPINSATEMLVSAASYADTIKKVVYHEHPIEKHRANIVTILQKFRTAYQSLLNHYFITEEEVMEYNISKLSERYPELKFSSERSVNRKEYGNSKV